jgi:diguanylate cyclase (GGDEF)-like protein
MAASLMHAIKREAAPHCYAAEPVLHVSRDDQVRRLMLLEQVASIANRSSDPAALLRTIVEITCIDMGFIAGNALVRDGVEGEVELQGCGAAFASDQDTGAGFIEVSNRFSTWACATLPGRLLLDPAPSTLIDLQNRPNFSRHREVQAIDARSMVAVPILVDGDLAGALEFFLDQDEAPDTRIIDLLCHISGEVAHVFRRALKDVQLRRDAVRDAATGLPNRAMFEAQLSLAFAAARTDHRPGPTLIVIEFEGFKRIRDMAGFQAGDVLLAEVTQRINCLVDEFGAADRLLLHYAHSIMFARIGGDDFAISIDGPDCENLSAEIAQAVHHNLRALECNCLGSPHISSSIGIAHDDGGYASPEELLRDADFAMYQAQTRGAEQTVIFDQQMRANNQAVAGMVAALQDAIRLHQFELHYQPIYTLANHHLVGVEALLRWRCADGTLMMPDDFIGIAEDHGLIGEIGSQALQMACKTMCVLSAAMPEVYRPFVSVNVSTQQFLQPRFLEEVREIIDDTGIDPALLVIEITESAAIMNLESSARLLAELRSWGVRVGLDDFGTGYSSLCHLQSLPLDGIKIDKSFVMNQAETNANWAIVTAILQMAKALDIRVIAEGIETEFQLSQLRELGCLIGQGYYFSRPIDRDGITALLGGGERSPSGI